MHRYVPLIAIGLLSTLATTSGEIAVVHEYRLGEANSLAPINHRPIDSVGSADFSTAINGSDARVETVDIFASGSTAYLNLETGSNAGFHGADFSSLPKDNFAMGIFARASRHIIGDIFCSGGPSKNGAFKLSLDANGWAASAHNSNWIGNPRGTRGSFEPNKWVHLALIRQNGVTTFFIDGVEQGTYAGIPQINQGHLGVAPAATSYFQGHLDEARIVIFSSNDPTELIIRSLQRTFNDRDQDGLADSVETNTGVYINESNTGTNPDSSDSDGDGLNDGKEVIFHKTDPNKIDTDSDGFLDLFEIETAYDPNSADSVPDALVKIMTAIEVKFNAALGATYTIEFSADSQNWSVVEDDIVGAGGAVERLYSKKDYPTGFFRVRRNQLR